MKSATAFITKSRGAWLTWLLVTVAWIVFALVQGRHQVQAWVNYHFDYEKTEADFGAEQQRAHSYREQLLAQIAAAASAAEAEARRTPGSIAKIDPQFLEYEVSKAGAKASAKKKYELTHQTGNIFTDIQNESSLAREVHLGAPPPRPSDNWLVALLAPPIGLALLVAFVPPALSSGLKTTRGRALIAATILWPSAVLAWGFVFQWEDYFRVEQYIGLLFLPPLLAAVGVRFWYWVRHAQA